MIIEKKEFLPTSWQYEVIRPGGNDTGIVFVSDISQLQKNPQLRQTIDKEIKVQNPTVEQVGFLDLTKPDFPTVMMAYEEFCGNFLRSCAYLIYIKTGRKNKKIAIKFVLKNEVLIISAGVDTFQQSWAEIPVKDTLITKTAEYVLVEMNGITHVVAPLPVTTQSMIDTARQFLIDNKLLNLIREKPALGVMFIDEKKDRQLLFPVVWVKDQVYFETACGSGSAACALAFQALLNRNQALELTQPSGYTICTTPVFEGSIMKSIKIAGTTKRLSSNTLLL